MTPLLRDFRYAVRTLRQRPGFSLTAILILALGIGANTAIFSLVDGVLLGAVPFVDAGELVHMRESTEDGRESPVSYPNFLDFKARQCGVFSDLVAHRPSGVKLTGSERPEHIESVWFSEGMCRLLGVEPTLGRCFTEGEDRPGTAGVVVLSWGFWQRRFGGQPGVLDRSVTLDDEPFEVVGVMPRGFVYPLSRRRVDVWLPLGHFGDEYEMMRRGTHPRISITARLAPRVSLEDLLARGVADDQALAVLLGLFACLAVLLASVGIYGVLAFSVAQRRREIGVRMALGARAVDVLRLIVGQGLLLALAGIAAGLGLALALAPLVASQLYGVEARDPSTFVTLPLVLAAVTLVACAVPARRASRLEPVRSLRYE